MYKGIRINEKIDRIPKNFEACWRKSRYTAESEPQISTVFWSSIFLSIKIQLNRPPLRQFKILDPLLRSLRASRMSIWRSNFKSSSVSLIYNILLFTISISSLEALADFGKFLFGLILSMLFVLNVFFLFSTGDVDIFFKPSSGSVFLEDRLLSSSLIWCFRFFINCRTCF